MKDIQKIVVFRLSSIGDIVLTTALLRNIRGTYPNAQIDFVVKRQFAGIVDMMPWVNNVYKLDSSLGMAGLHKLRAELSQNKYDVILDIHKNWRSQFIRNTIFAKKIVTFKKHVFKRFLLIKFKLDAYNVPRPVYLRFIDAGVKIGVKNDGNKTELVIPDDVQKKVDNYLEDHKIKPHKDILVLCPGASFLNKEWTADNFKLLAEKIISELKFQVVLLGGAKEQAVCEEIANAIEGSILSVAGKFSLPQSGALLNRTRITIANDTGMLHMSEALKVPVVGIYGPTVRQFGYSPILEKSKVAQIELACRPCTKMGMNHCPKGTFDCTKLISVEMVFKMITQILEEK